MSATLTLRHAGRVFLERRGFEIGLFGVYVHRIAGPDPGLDLHDHPWPFVTLVLSGGYTEEAIDTRDAPNWAKGAEILEDMLHERGTVSRGHERTWRALSVHRMRLTDSHRITDVRPGTWTLVIRGRKSRPWGFYQPDGFVDHREYDFAVRRPVTVEEGP